MLRLPFLFIIAFILNSSTVQAGKGLKRLLKEEDYETARTLCGSRKAKLEETKRSVQDKETLCLLDTEMSTLETYIELKFLLKGATEELKQAKKECKEVHAIRKKK